MSEILKHTKKYILSETVTTDNLARFIIYAFAMSRGDEVLELAILEYCKKMNYFEPKNLLILIIKVSKILMKLVKLCSIYQLEL